jgi:hypothetical protein
MKGGEGGSVSDWGEEEKEHIINVNIYIYVNIYTHTHIYIYIIYIYIYIYIYQVVSTRALPVFFEENPLKRRLNLSPSRVPSQPGHRRGGGGGGGGGGCGGSGSGDGRRWW